MSDSGSPMWLLKLPAVANHAIPRREKLRRHFLGRGLAGAAGDRHDLRARLVAEPRAPAPAAPRSCRRPRSTSGAGRAGLPRRRDRRAARSPPRRPRPRAIAAATNRRRRTARRGSRRTARPAASVRVSIDTPPNAPRRRRPRPAVRRAPRPSRRPLSAIAAATRVTHATPDLRAPRAPAPRAPPPRRRTAASGRRSPGTSRAPCRRSARDRRAAPARSPCAIAARAIDDRQRRRCAAVLRARVGGVMPRWISSMIRSGSSLRGLSDVIDDQIAQPAGDRAHQRPLGAIAIAAAAEHGDQPAAARAAAPSRAGSAARRRCARSRRRR